MSQISSLQHTSTIITVASWEERFLLGMTQLIEESNPERVLMFYYSEYEEWSRKNRASIANLCKEKDILLLEPTALSFRNPLEPWREMVSKVAELAKDKQNITLDISTMPRETIWSIAHVLLSVPGNVIRYIYNKPGPNGYGEWLSRDPGRPRLLYRLAGIQHLGRPTALVVQSGFDVERVKQLVRFYEPDRVLLGLQQGTQFGNQAKNRNEHEAAFECRSNTELFDVDGYSLTDCLNEFYLKTAPLLESHNVIVSSLGPKIGALSLFLLKTRLPDLALSYTPSNEFNQDYSQGIGERICGNVNSEAPKA